MPDTQLQIVSPPVITSENAQELAKELAFRFVSETQSMFGKTDSDPLTHDEAALMIVASQVLIQSIKSMFLNNQG